MFVTHLYSSFVKIYNKTILFFIFILHHRSVFFHIIQELRNRRVWTIGLFFFNKKIAYIFFTNMQ